jgi:hypothetical protein
MLGRERGEVRLQPGLHLDPQPHDLLREPEIVLLVFHLLRIPLW